MFLVSLIKKVGHSNDSAAKKSDSQPNSLILRKQSGDSSSPRASKVQRASQSSRALKNFYIVQKMSDSRFPVYQVLLQGNRTTHALKVYEDQEDQIYYHNEARFAMLKHPNIVNILSHDSQKEVNYDGQLTSFSHILMEYAPNGDFFDVIKNYGAYFNDKIIRSYFHQLIEGLEYLHENRVAHLDLKPENLLLGSDYKLKITDFDRSYVQGDNKILSKGTKLHRAPELQRAERGNIQLKLPFAADIYSVGIILFLFKSRVFPCFENQAIEGYDLQDLMHSHSGDFWRIHCDIQDKPASFYDPYFRELFEGMMKVDPAQRWTLKQIKRSKWYNGPTYGKSKLQRRMSEILHQASIVEA